MSYILKCDICGKDSAMTGVQFSTEPVTIEINTYNNRKMNVSLSIDLEDSEDRKNINKMSSIINTMLMRRSLEGDIDPDMSSEEIFQDAAIGNIDKLYAEFKDKILMLDDSSIGLKLENPNPFICSGCKKELAYKALMEGKVQPSDSFVYSTDSTRLQPLPDSVISEVVNAIDTTLEQQTDKPTCTECGVPISKKSKTGLCRPCYLESIRKNKDSKDSKKKK